MKLTHLSTPRLVTSALALLFAFCGWGCDQDHAATPTYATASIPFTLELKEIPANSTPAQALPAVHSFSMGTDGQGNWLIIGGRIAGLHGFGSGSNNFPRSSANTTAYVINPATNTLVASAELSQLPANLSGPLTATNPQFIQAGTDLYIVGGYGLDSTSGNMITFGSIIKVDVPGLINAIKQQKPIAPFFTQNPSSDNRLKVTGGELAYSQGIFYLVFGQDFTGLYSIHNADYNRAGGQFQKYTEKVRVFSLNADLSIKDFNQIDGGYDDALPYNRRDLNVVEVINPDGVTPAVTVYGGVFQAGRIAGHTTPIDLPFSSSVSGASPLIRNTFQQGLSHYACAAFTLFDSGSNSSFTTLFGGISQYHYDSTNNTLVLDALDLAKGIDGLPFINTVSTIQRGANLGESGPSPFLYAQYILPGLTLPPNGSDGTLLGTEAHFIPATGISSYSNGVIKLAALSGKTLVGYIYGGIQSYGPYSALVSQSPSTLASARLFAVYVTPTSSPAIPLPPLPTTPTPYPAATPAP